MPYQPVTFTLGALDSGIRGTNQTLREMARLVRRDSKDPRIVALARSIVADVKAHDELGEVQEIFNYVKNNLRYVQDPVDCEWVQDAERSLVFAAGDCDDFKVLFATLCAAIGYVSVFVIGGYDPNPDSQYDHVWDAVYANGKWLNADSTEDRPLGWRSKDFAKLAYFPIFEGTPVPSQLGNLGQDDSFDSFFFDDTSSSGDTSGDSFDWSSIFGDDTGSTGGGGTFDPNFDTGDYTDPNSPLYDPSYDSSDDLALFDYLQQNYGYTGTKIDDMSLQDIGIYMNPNGSYMQLGSDGSLSFHNADGSFVALTDTSGQPLNGAGQTPQALKQIANQAANALGSGGGIPLGSSGGTPKPPVQQPTSTADSLAKTISSIANSIKSALSGTPLQQYTGTRINPLTGRPISSNTLYTSPQGAGLQLNTTTIIIGALLLVVLMKK